MALELIMMFIRFLVLVFRSDELKNFENCQNFKIQGKSFQIITKNS